MRGNSFITHSNNYDNENALLKQLIKMDDLFELLNLIKSQFTSEINFNGYAIALLNENQNGLVIYDCLYHGNYKEMEKVHIHNNIKLSSKDYFSLCYNNGLVLHIKEEEINSISDAENNRYSRWGVKNELYLPILTEKQNVGVICLYSLENEFENSTISNSNKIIQIFSESINKALKVHYLREKEKESKNIISRNQKVLEIANDITKLTSIEVIYDMILGAIIKIFNFDIGAIFLEKNNFLEYKKSIARENKEVQRILSKYNAYFSVVKGYELNAADGATGNVFNRNDPLYFKDLSIISKLPMAEKDKNGILALERPKTLLLMPIVKDEFPIGVFQLWGIIDNTVELSDSDIHTISKLSSFFGTAIKNSELYTIIDKQNKTIEKAKTEIEEINIKLLNDLKIAKRIQESIINSIPSLPDVYIEAEYLAMESLGGDVYDVRRIGKSTYSFMISDVSGHGLPAALITTMAKTSFINHGHFSKTPDVTCKEVNKDLFELIGNTDYYLTAFYSVLDTEKLELLYANCGHQDGIIYKRKTGEIIELKATGLFIGIMDSLEFTFDRIKLDINDKIILYTDGITEARNNLDEFYTIERLTKYIKKNGRQEPSVFLKGLLNDLNDFCQNRGADDDRAILLIEILPRSLSNDNDKDVYVDFASLSDSTYKIDNQYQCELLKNKILELGLKDKSYNDQIDNSIFLYKNNQMEKALEILDKLYPYFDDDVRLLNLMGIILFKKKQLEESLSIFNKIKSINPNFPNISAMINLIDKQLQTVKN